MNRFLIIASFVTVAACFTGWAHASTKTCTVTERLVTTPDGAQHIVRKVVCEVSQ